MEKAYFTDVIDNINVETFLRERPTEDYRLYFSTPGGNVHAGMLLTFELKNDPHLREIFCYGDVGSFGLILLAALKDAVRRKAFWTAEFVFHDVQFTTDEQTKASLAVITEWASSLQRSKDKLKKILENNLNMKPKDVEYMFNGEEKYITAEEALELGLIDEVIYGFEDQED